MNDSVVSVRKDRFLTVCVVSHTHWDREWYHAAPRFRQRLVALVDVLLKLPADATRPFLLDGQAVVIEDYLTVRPERRAEIEAQLSVGAIEAGPWYVLGDGLIPSGEAIVRNLLAGRRVLRRLNVSAPPVAYCPDTFGHPAALPLIANGFGFKVAIVWRGLGGARSPSGDVMRWRAASGDEVIVYHLPRDGYETGSALPVAVDAAKARWKTLGAMLHARATVGLALLPNGADHHAQQPDIEGATATLTDIAKPDHIVRTSLGEFANRLLAAIDEQRADLPQIVGELRDSYGYTWTLGGTLATRAAQKRKNAKAERALLRDVEPWLVLAWLHGTVRVHDVSDNANITLAQAPALLDVAWRTLLRAHPHDTLCGCSIDDVARAMDTRLSSTMTQAAGLREAALALALEHDVVAAQSRAIADTPTLVVRNRAARWRGGVAEVCIDQTLSDELVGPSSADQMPNAGALGSDSNSVSRVHSVVLRDMTLQFVRSKVVRRRRESPQHYPDNDLVLANHAIAWVPPVPPLGLAMHRVHATTIERKDDSTIGARSSGEIDIHTDRLRPSHPSQLRELDHAIELQNGRLTVSVDSAGVTIIRGNRTIRNALAFETTSDVGDAYTPANCGEPLLLVLKSFGATLRGPLRSSAQLDFSIGNRTRGIRLTATLVLDADCDFVRVDVRGHNARRDHRLRMLFSTDVVKCVDRNVWADAAFHPVKRVTLDVPVLDQQREHVPPTMPMHRWVTVSNAQQGATLHADGLAEVEVKDNGCIALTLLRAIGELSRNDLVERPGHAGWPASIPLAQAQGSFRARSALQLHGEWSATTRDAIEIASDALLLPLTGETWRDLVASRSELAGPELTGNGLRWSTVALSDDDDGIVLRCTNDSDVEQSGAWTLPNGDWEFARTRLDETLLNAWTATNNRIEISVPAQNVLTLRVRRRAN